MRKLKFSLVVLLVGIFVITLATSVNANSQNMQIVEQKYKVAPLSPKFLDWLKKNEEGKNSKPKDGNNGSKQFALGHIPSPIDLSHLKNNPPKIQNDNKNKSKGATLPSKYDLRAYNRIPTAVRNQNPYGTCWAHAAMGAMESSYMTQGFTSLGSQPDLSELNLAWFAFKDPEAGHSYTYNIDKDHPTILDQGGYALKSTAYFARMGGPVNESSMPYSVPGTDKSYTDNLIASYVGSNTPKDYTKVLKMRAQYDIGEITANNRDLVKQMVMTYGAVEMAYWCEDTTSVKAYFSDSTGNEDTNHEVLIIGWDDNYSRENFNSYPSRMPSTDGAWLVRNSWGSNWGDGGYFYLSYEQFIDDATVYVAGEYSSDERYYGYDDLGQLSSFGYGLGTPVYAANVFKAESSEQIKSVGFYTTDNNAEYEIYIFEDLGTSQPTNPFVSGATPVASGTEPYAGYHILDISKTLNVTEGHYFSVVVKMTTPNYDYPIAFETPYGWAPAVVNAGESYFTTDTSSWQDGKNMGNGRNACIKVFTTGGTKYKVFDLGMTWEEAKKYCENLGGHLATITSEEEYNYVLSLLPKNELKLYWLGAKKSENSDEWQWITGEPFIFTKWHEGEPNNQGNSENCLEMTNYWSNYNGQWGWNDENGNMTLSGFICEWEETPLVTLQLKKSMPSSGTLGKEFTGYVRVSGGTSYKWKKKSGTLPTGLKLSSTSKAKVILSGTPTKAGKFTFTLEVTDKSGVKATKKCTVTIAPKIDGTMKSKGTYNTAYTGNLTASGGSSYTWKKVSGTLPTGLKLSSTSKAKVVLSGTPTKAGKFTFTLRVTTNSVTADKSCTVTIAPKISGTLPKGMVGTPYTGTLIASGGSSYTWKKVSGTLPTGLKLSSTSKAKVVLSGTPTKAGKFTFTLRVTTNSVTADKSCTVTIAPKISGIMKVRGTVGTKYTGNLTASGGSSYTWKKVSGTLPTGLKLSSTSKAKVVLSGTPTKAGKFTFTLRVTVNEVTTDKKCTVTIAAASTKTGTSNNETENETPTTKTKSSQSEEFEDEEVNSALKDSLAFAERDEKSEANYFVVNENLTSLEVLSDDILWQGEEKDEDLIGVQINSPVTFIIGEWIGTDGSITEVSDILVYIDEIPVEDVTISGEGLFTIPAELVKNDFKVQVKALTNTEELETEELYISVEE